MHMMDHKTAGAVILGTSYPIMQDDKLKHAPQDTTGYDQV